MITKYKFFLDFDKEEKWLNAMAGQGYFLTAKNFLSGYLFQSGEPGDTKLRIDYRVFNKDKDFEDYRNLFEDCGWKHVAGTKYSGTQYFARTRESSEEDIFSDQASRAGRYKRLSGVWLSIFIAYLPLIFVFLSKDLINLNVFQDPRMLYLTPGLWEKTAGEFWRAFLFETPFALLRGLAWLLIPLTIVLYLFFSLRAYACYRKALDQQK